MKAYKWDFEKCRYDEVDIPDTCSNYKDNFSEEVTCPNCGRQVRYGDTYTSRRWHDRVGFGYGVCERCHELEALEEGAANGR